MSATLPVDGTSRGLLALKLVQLVNSKITQPDPALLPVPSPRCSTTAAPAMKNAPQLPLTGGGLTIIVSLSALTHQLQTTIWTTTNTMVLIKSVITSAPRECMEILNPKAASPNVLLLPLKPTTPLMVPLPMENFVNKSVQVPNMHSLEPESVSLPA